MIRDNIDYWIISTSGDTTGAYFELESVYVIENVTVGDYTFTSYTVPQSYWRGYSQIDFRVDQDWLLGTTFQSISASAGSFPTWAIVDYSNLPILTMDTSYQSGQISYNLPVSLMTISKTASTNGQQWTKLMNAIYKDIVFTPSGINQKSVSACNINNLCIIAGARGSSDAVVVEKVAIVLACPKDKLPSGLHIGDPFPIAEDINVNVNVNVPTALNQWEQMQYDYAMQVVQYGQTTQQLGALGSANSLIVNDVTDNTIGEFDVSNAQINDIASALQGSFYIHLLTISGLFIVLLFFVKKGMA